MSEEGKVFTSIFVVLPIVMAIAAIPITYTVQYFNLETKKLEQRPCK